MTHYLALWLLVRVAGRLPLGLLDRMASLAGTAAWWGSRRVRAVTRDHMRHVLGPTARASMVDRAAREAARSAARGYAEFAHLPHLSPTAVRARVVAEPGMEELTAAAREGHGAILVSAHLGAPEVLSHAAPTFGIRFAGISEPLRPPRVHDFVHATRRVAGVEYFPGTLAGLRAAREHLADGGVLGLLVDRDVLGTGHPYALFGEQALMPTGAAELARRTGAPVVAVWCYRAGSGRYRLVAHRVALPASTGDRSADVDSAMRAILAALEAAIREAPGQWFPLVPVWRGLVAERTDEVRPGPPVQ